MSKWTDDEFGERYGEVLADLNLEKSLARWFIVIYPLSLLLRRLSLAFVLIFWREFMWGQIALMFLTSQALICYILWFRPFETKLVTNIETFNELSNMATLYLMLAFSDAEPNVHTRNVLYGNIFIGIVCIYLLVHVILML